MTLPATPHARRWRMPLLVRISVGLHCILLVLILQYPQAWPWMLAVLVANHLLLTAIGLWPRSSWLGANWTRLPAAAIARREIALTIDDGPDPEVTPQVLDLLERHGVKASFFCIGTQALRYPALCRDIVARGHALENHSQHHRHYFSLLGPASLAQEINTAQETLTRLSGQRPVFFRAPAGLRNLFLDPVLQRLDLRLAAWSRRGFDTRSGDPQRVCSRLLQGLAPGAILLLHDRHCKRTEAGVPVLLEVLPVLIAAAHDAGLQFVTLRAALRP